MGTTIYKGITYAITFFNKVPVKSYVDTSGIVCILAIAYIYLIYNIISILCHKKIGVCTSPPPNCTCSHAV